MWWAGHGDLDIYGCLQPYDHAKQNYYGESCTDSRICRSAGDHGSLRWSGDEFTDL